MRQIGEILIEQGSIEKEKMKLAFRLKPRGTIIGNWLIKSKLITTQELGTASAVQCGVPYFDIDARVVAT